MKDKEIELKDGHANIENIYDFFKQYGLGESDVTYEGIPSLMKKYARLLMLLSRKPRPF